MRKWMHNWNTKEYFKLRGEEEELIKSSLVKKPQLSIIKNSVRQWKAGQWLRNNMYVLYVLLHYVDPATPAPKAEHHITVHS